MARLARPGVLLAFALTHESDRRAQQTIYASELNAAITDLAGLAAVCDRLAGQLRARAIVLDEMNKPPNVVALLQSPRFQASAGYPIRAGLASILTAIDAVRPQLEFLRQNYKDLRGHRLPTAQSVDALGNLLALLAPLMEDELKRSGGESFVTKEDRDAVASMKAELQRLTRNE